MTSAIIAGLLALGVGVGHNFLLRYLAGRVAYYSVTAIPMVAAAASVRLMVVVLTLGVLVSWGVAPALGALAGYWLGRTAVVALSLRRQRPEPVEGRSV